MDDHVTEDALALGDHHPAETGINPDATEERTRRYGRRCFRSGITLCFIAMIGSLAGAVLTEQHIFDTDGGELLATLGFVGCMAIGASLTIIGGVERLTRSQRAMHRRVLTGVDQLQAGTERLTGAVRGCSHTVLELVGPLPGQLGEIEKRLTAIEDAIGNLPDYGQGVIDGAQMRANALYSDGN